MLHLRRRPPSRTRRAASRRHGRGVVRGGACRCGRAGVVQVFRLLGLRRLRHQPLRAAIAVLAVAGGVSLVVSIFVTTSSIERSVRTSAAASPARRRCGSSAPPSGAASTARRRRPAAEAVDGVAAAGADGPGGTLADGVAGASRRDTGPRPRRRLPRRGAHRRRSAATRPCSTASPTARSSSGPASPGRRRPRLRTDPGGSPSPASPSLDALDALNDGRVVVFALADAQRAVRAARARRHRLRRPRRRAPTIGAAARRPRGGRRRPERRARRRRPAGRRPRSSSLTFLPLFGMLGLFGLGTGAVLVHNTVRCRSRSGAGSWRPRRARRRPPHGRRRRRRRGGVLGLAGGALGVARRHRSSPAPIVASLSGFTEAVAGITLQRTRPGSASSSIGVVLGAVVGAARRAPARPAGRCASTSPPSCRAAARVAEARPIRLVRRALHLDGGRRRRRLRLLVGLAGRRASSSGRRRYGPLGFLLVAARVADARRRRLAPLLIDRVAGAHARSRSATVLLAFADLVRDPRRTGIMAVAVASPMIVGFATDGFVSSARAEHRGGLRRRRRRVGVDASRSTPATTPTSSPDALAALAALPGVERAAPPALRLGRAATLGDAHRRQRLRGHRPRPASTSSVGTPTSTGSAPARCSSARGWPAAPAPDPATPSSVPTPTGMVDAAGAGHLSRTATSAATASSSTTTS